MSAAPSALYAFAVCDLPQLRAGGVEAAEAGVVDHLQGLSATQIQQLLAAQGDEIAPEFAAELEREVAQRLECRKAANVVQAHDESAATAVDLDHGASVHGGHSAGAAQ